MNPNIDPFETRLADALRRSSHASPHLGAVLRRARQRVAVRNVLSLILARIWLALARLLAPAAQRLHRLSHPSRKDF